MIYDIIGVGIGPFNLGLAAMSHNHTKLNSIFFDQNPEFQWHPGMLLASATLQVPFYADLVTVVDPTSPFTFLNYLKNKQKLFRFAIHENNFITRFEYNDYCQWIAAQLPNLFFNHKVVNVIYNSKHHTYFVTAKNQKSGSFITCECRHLVIGIGSVPHIPGNITLTPHSAIIHSADYLNVKTDLIKTREITIVGSGQSAAEIFYDLLQHTDSLDTLHWYTRSERFYPMEYSKLTLEMTSIDYIDHFYSLSDEKKNNVLAKQNMLYKGINFSLINQIYDALYTLQLQNHNTEIRLHTNCELTSILENDAKLSATFYHHECDEKFDHYTNSIILATGYKPSVPGFLNNISGRIKWENGIYQVNRNFSVDSHNQVFIQNAELHSHGFSAPDLGMGPYRNATILNTILNREVFILERGIAFQEFGVSAKTKSIAHS